MERRLAPDYLSSFYEAKQSLASASKQQRIFAHPTAKSKLIRQSIYQYIENHNSSIDTQINCEIAKFISIVKHVIVANNIAKLQELVSHGILKEINDGMNTCDDADGGDSSKGSNSSRSIVTDIVGCALQHNREEALLIIAPFMQCKFFDISKFDKPLLDDPYKCVLFLHHNGYIDLRTSSCKLFIMAAENGHPLTVRYCLDQGVPVNVRQNRAIRDAAAKGHLDVVRLLHSKGADIHQYSDESFRKAAKGGHIHVMQYLIAHGADVRAKDSHAFTRSAENGHVNCIELLIKHGIRKEENVAATKSAIKNRHYDALGALLKHGYTLYNQRLRKLKLGALYGCDDNSSAVKTDEQRGQDEDSCELYSPKRKRRRLSSPDLCGTFGYGYGGYSYDTESSASPPVSPEYRQQSPCSSVAEHTLSVGSSSAPPAWFDDDTADTQMFLGAISEGLALREAMLMSVLTQFMRPELAQIVCEYEKLALTYEDEEALKPRYSK